MRYLIGFMCVLALAVMGCSETSGTGGDGGAGGEGGVGGDGGTGGTVTLVAYTFEADGWRLGPRLPGVEVCQTDTTNCVESDANGVARLVLPADQEISYTVMLDGHMPWLLGDVTDETFGAEGRPGYPMFPNEFIQEFAEMNGITYPLTSGVTSHHMNPLRTRGVTYELIDVTGREYYVDDDLARTPRFDLTATTSDGFGGYWEVPPGAHQVEFGGTAMNCTVALAWPGNGPDRVRVPVRVGHITLATMNCDVQQSQ